MAIEPSKGTLECLKKDMERERVENIVYVNKQWEDVELGIDVEPHDVVIYDVPGDIVCGGFGIPLRRGLANEVYIVASADYLSIAANNICRGARRFAKRGAPYSVA